MKTTSLIVRRRLHEARSRSGMRGRGTTLHRRSQGWAERAGTGCQQRRDHSKHRAHLDSSVITSSFSLLVPYPIKPISVNCCEKKHKPLARTDLADSSFPLSPLSRPYFSAFLPRRSNSRLLSGRLLTLVKGKQPGAHTFSRVDLSPKVTSFIRNSSQTASEDNQPARVD